MRTLESLLDTEFDVTDDEVLTLLQDHWFCDIAEMDGKFCNACLAVVNHEMVHGNLTRKDFPGVINFNKVKCKKPYGWGGINPLRTRLINYIKYFMEHAHANRDSVEQTIKDICGDRQYPIKIDYKESRAGGRRKIIIKATVEASPSDAMYDEDRTGTLRMVFIQLKR